AYLKGAIKKYKKAQQRKEAAPIESETSTEVVSGNGAAELQAYREESSGKGMLYAATCKLIPGTEIETEMVFPAEDDGNPDKVRFYLGYFPEKVIEDLPQTRQITIRPIHRKNFESIERYSDIREGNRLVFLRFL